METTVTVLGMTCDHCVKSVSEELLKIDGVTEVKVDLETGNVDISTNSQIPQLAITAAISEAGYEIK